MPQDIGKNSEAEKDAGRSILDAVSHAQQTQALRTLNPQQIVSELLQTLPERENKILQARYGLDGTEPLTLEEIGKSLGLTRERIRQIEREAIKKLQSVPNQPELEQIKDLAYQILEENGQIAAEEKIVELLGVSARQPAEQAVKFILRLVPGLAHLRAGDQYRDSWHLPSFDQPGFNRLIALVKSIFEEEQKTLQIGELWEKAKSRTGETRELFLATHEVLENVLAVSREVSRNQFGQWGLQHWPEIRPKDVGDKAFLVLDHSGQPAHYEKITEMINRQKFDDRTAHKETVHNELIKDQRFVLVGRGIYALRKWGYEPGTVAHVIESILKKHAMPMKRDEIVGEVLKRRLVKRNTVIVGLSNKAKFKKRGDGRYSLAGE